MHKSLSVAVTCLTVNLLKECSVQCNAFSRESYMGQGRCWKQITLRMIFIYFCILTIVGSISRQFSGWMLHSGCGLL